MKKFYLSLLLALFFALAVSSDATPFQEITYNGMDFIGYCGLPDKPEVNAFSAYVYSIETGSVIYAKNAFDTVYPASAVKLMTAVVAYDYLGGNMETRITASETAVKASRGANSMIRAGEEFTAEQLFYMLLVTGSNDAANVLAEHIGGTVDEFVGMMNRKAEALGMTATHYVNPTGIHDERMVSSARDIAMLARCFYEYDTLLTMSDTARFVVPPTNKTDTVRTLLNRNYLIAKVRKDSYYFAAATGMSLGSTDEAGECIVTTARDDTGLGYIAVLMNEPDDDENVSMACADAKTLLSYCFDAFAKSTVLSPKNIVCEIPVTLSTGTDYVTLFPNGDIRALLPSDFDLAADITVEPRVSAQSVSAPIRTGDVFGEVIVRYKNDLVLGAVPLVAGKDVSRSDLLAFFDTAERFIKGTWFRVFVISSVVLLAAYFTLSVIIDRRRRRRGSRRRR